MKYLAECLEDQQSIPETHTSVVPDRASISCLMICTGSGTEQLLLYKFWNSRYSTEAQLYSFDVLQVLVLY